MCDFYNYPFAETDEYSPMELNSIESLGYSKNHLVEALETGGLPPEYEDKLHQAYSLLDEVQEYLFSSIL